MKRPILLIEDDQWLADSYLTVLRSRGHDVTQLSSAFEAMPWIDKYRPALIIADLLLGDHTTLTLLHELQSHTDLAGIPVVVVSQIDQRELDPTDLAHYGVVESLDKATLTPDRLLMTIEGYLPKQSGVDG
ncbi:MAG TPA: response regulator [Candidatus Saccharimonadales bacterium]|jgi:DNA-binding NtrC family response regulator